LPGSTDNHLVLKRNCKTTSDEQNYTGIANNHIFNTNLFIDVVVNKIFVKIIFGNGNVHYAIGTDVDASITNINAININAINTVPTSRLLHMPSDLSVASARRERVQLASELQPNAPG